MSSRGSSFTEAVPLSLSSMAHMSVPLEEGVVDGIRQVVQHTLWSCVNYVRAVHAPHEWTFRDLTTSPNAWKAVKTPHAPRDLPWALTKLHFKHQYPRHAWIYWKPAMPNNLTPQDEMDFLQNDWTQHAFLLGRISLLYATQELLTPDELNGHTDTDDDDDEDDTPPTVLYKVVVEYRSLPPTGNQQAVQAEELSMLSFGGSIDDDVKYGALASLYDEHAKYVLEIYSVRGKKYKFDLMDATLSDGTVPRLHTNNHDDDDDDGNRDPFVKSLCVTVTDHAPATATRSGSLVMRTSSEDTDAMVTTPTTTSPCAITRMHLTLDGNIRRRRRRGAANASYQNHYNSSDKQGLLQGLPPFGYVTSKLQESFLLFHTQTPTMVTAVPSGQTLLLDPCQAGKIYLNGRYITTWGKDVRIGSQVPALFGMDLHSIPYWHGRIMDYEWVKRIYAQLWYEILIDARFMPFDIGGRLLQRLLHGREEDLEDEDDEDDDDDDDDEDLGDDSEVYPPAPKKKKKKNQRDNKVQSSGAASNPHTPCLEAEVLSSKHYDPVGIAAKALATRFSKEYGKHGFPCLEHEMEWARSQLPHSTPVAVPQRVLDILRRGGYFHVKFTANEVWGSQTRPPMSNELAEQELVEAAVSLLQEADCHDVKANQIVLVPGLFQDSTIDPIAKKAMCRYNPQMKNYYVHPKLFDPAYLGEYRSYFEKGADATTTNDTNMEHEGGVNSNSKLLAYLLGMNIAQQHPDGRTLVRYLLRHSPPTAKKGV